MKFIPFYKDTLKCTNDDQVFEYFLANLKPSLKRWDYFVNWEKVFENTREIEVHLNTLNFLIGKDDFDNEFCRLLLKAPELAKALPALVVRGGGDNNRLQILVDYNSKKLVYKDYDFDKSNITESDIKSYLEFVTKTGVRELIVSQKIKNLVDYMIGVEAGLDSHGRKQRGGSAMEEICESFIADECFSKKYEFLRQADARKIFDRWGITVPVDKSSRIYDFVVNNGKSLIIIETNFYGGVGSKLKSTAGEYRDLFNIISGHGYRFVWITDGFGWKTTNRPLRETFNHNEFVINLDMVERNILDDLLRPN